MNRSNFYMLRFVDGRTFTYDDLLSVRHWLPDEELPAGHHRELDGLKQVSVSACGVLVFYQKTSAKIVLADYEDSRKNLGGPVLRLTTYSGGGVTEKVEELVDGGLVEVAFQSSPR